MHAATGREIFHEPTCYALVAYFYSAFYHAPFIVYLSMALCEHHPAEAGLLMYLHFIAVQVWLQFGFGGSKV
jgi:hypothetical protein